MQSPVAEYNNFHMNTEVYARVYGSNAANVITDVSFELVQLENVLSCYLPESEISRIYHVVGDGGKVLKEDL
jgi:thiamine biosynthesis lipoprotein